MQCEACLSKQLDSSFLFPPNSSLRQIYISVCVCVRARAVPHIAVGLRRQEDECVSSLPLDTGLSGEEDIIIQGEHSFLFFLFFFAS